MSRIVRRPAAGRDLIDAYRYYARKAGMRVADRFFDNAEATLKRLARLPGLGATYETEILALQDLRYFPISRFPDQIVFYKRLSNGIEVYRVLHGARDVEGVLAGEFS